MAAARRNKADPSRIVKDSNESKQSEQTSCQKKHAAMGSQAPLRKACGKIAYKANQNCDAAMGPSNESKRLQQTRRPSKHAAMGTQAPLGRTCGKIASEADQNSEQQAQWHCCHAACKPSEESHDLRDVRHVLHGSSDTAFQCFHIGPVRFQCHFKATDDESASLPHILLSEAP